MKWVSSPTPVSSCSDHGLSMVNEYTHQKSNQYIYSTRVIVLSDAQSVVGLDRLIDKDQLLGRRMVRIIMNLLSTEGIPTLFSQ